MTNQPKLNTFYKLSINPNKRFETLRDVKDYVNHYLDLHPSLLIKAVNQPASQLLDTGVRTHVTYHNNRKSELYVFLDRNQKIITVDKKTIRARLDSGYQSPAGKIPELVSTKTELKKKGF